MKKLKREKSATQKKWCSKKKGPHGKSAKNKSSAT